MVLDVSVVRPLENVHSFRGFVTYYWQTNLYKQPEKQQIINRTKSQRKKRMQDLKEKKTTTMLNKKQKQKKHYNGTKRLANKH